MATVSRVMNSCVSSAISSPSSFEKLKGSRKKTTANRAPKSYRICCGSTNPVASDPYKILWMEICSIEMLWTPYRRMKLFGRPPQNTKSGSQSPTELQLAMATASHGTPALRGGGGAWS
ncbi:hypothetical protein L1987_05779 [Smallanthus sonchifolius]|uniref:Uncharacterized protein n=1 Tax=Smallanthus sonchifolius TaxID=185202 RepID=A0ACB9JWF4_9ASTR|nr:hypothetical protein L1987_05779 [Smallanthus sonchifolius]